MSRLRAFRSTVSIALFALGIGLLGVGTVPAAADPGPPSGPARILLYGDSMTMASTGDWTWRYRLWQVLRQSGAGFDFVGPRDDHSHYVGWYPGSRRYRAPAFDADHAAISGLRLTDGRLLPGDLAFDHRPDVVVALIGFNDLRAGVTPATLERTWYAQIGKIRRANPDVAVVLVPVPQTWFPGVTEYNRRLGDLATRLDTPQARVLLAERPDFSVFRDTYDYTHPSAAGERRIAVSVAAALERLGVGSGPAAMPDPAPSGAWAPQPDVSASGSSVTVRWDAVDYASSQHVFVRDVTTNGGGVFQFVTGTSMSFAARPGHTYDVWLAPVKGYLELGTRSSSARVTVPAA